MVGKAVGVDPIRCPAQAAVSPAPRGGRGDVAPQQVAPQQVAPQDVAPQEVVTTTRGSISFYFDQEMEQEVTADYPFGRVSVFSAPSPLHPERNEDAAVVIPIDGRRAVLAVADGAGGHEGARRAAHLAVATLASALSEERAAGGSVRDAVLRGFDRANERILGGDLASACTLIAVELEGPRVRTYHVGDSTCLVFGREGQRKLQTTAHSPVGYALEAGVLDEREAMSHQYRHLVSNLLGSQSMHVELGSGVELTRHDTVVLASDGLFDNLHVAEIVERLGGEPLEEALRRTVAEVRRRMGEPRAGRPSKPDDLTVVAFRPAPSIALGGPDDETVAG